MALAAAVSRQLELLQSSIEPVERLVHVVTESLPQPIFYDSGGTHAGFRYGKPDARHFCLLKLVRATSALNAMICLARSGYSQEIAVLVRVFTECTTQIEFTLLAQSSEGELARDAKQLLEDYFADFSRNDVTDHKQSKIHQALVHKHLGAEQDRLAALHDTTPISASSEALYRRITRSFSAYVHCKYPETMDLCGGRGPHFHIRGMSGTPKDDENIALLTTFAETARLTARSMILRLALFEVIQSDQTLLAWYRAESAVVWRETRSDS